MRTIRSFIAVNIGLNALRAVAEEQSGLRRRVSERGAADVRWVAPQNLHVTIRFLGQVTEPMVAAIQDGLEPVVRTIAPFEVTAAGLGVFPDEVHPLVVWVGLRDEGALGRLYDGISEVLVRMGFNLDAKPFRSHVTIGRVKGGDGAALAACLTESGERAYGAFTVREVVCYRSDLRPNGADYHMLWRVPLGGRVRGARPEEAEPMYERETRDEPPATDAADDAAEDAAGEAPDEGETKE